MTCAEDNTSQAGWSELIEHRKDVLLQGFTLFRDHLVVRERKEGLTSCAFAPGVVRASTTVDFGEPAYTARPDINRNADSTVLRFNYTSLTTPSSTFDYDMVGRKKDAVKANRNTRRL